MIGFFFCCDLTLIVNSLKNIKKNIYNKIVIFTHFIESSDLHKILRDFCINSWNYKKKNMFDLPFFLVSIPFHISALSLNIFSLYNHHILVELDDV